MTRRQVVGAVAALLVLGVGGVGAWVAADQSDTSEGVLDGVAARFDDHAEEVRVVAVMSPT